MNSETDQLPFPRVVLLMEHVVARLGLRAVPPFTFNASLGVFAVAGGLLLPHHLGEVAGSLLAMQALVTVSFFFLMSMLFMRHNIRLESRCLATKRQSLQGWTWAFDGFAAGFLLVSVGTGGLPGPLEFIVLAGAAYIPMVRDRLDRRAVAELGVSLVLFALLLILLAVLFRLPEQFEHWAGARGSMAATGCYFGAMTAAEAVGAHRRIAGRLLTLAARTERDRERGA